MIDIAYTIVTSLRQSFRPSFTRPSTTTCFDVRDGYTGTVLNVRYLYWVLRYSWTVIVERLLHTVLDYCAGGCGFDSVKLLKRNGQWQCVSRSIPDAPAHISRLSSLISHLSGLSAARVLYSRETLCLFLWLQAMTSMIRPSFCGMHGASLPRHTLSAPSTCQLFAYMPVYHAPVIAAILS
jgi:hypothetical protein